MSFERSSVHVWQALFIAIIFAACAGPADGPLGVIPASSQAATASVSDKAIVPDAGKLCPDPGSAYVFHGACTSGTMKSSGGTFKLAAYKGVTAKLVFGANNGPNAFQFAVRDALGNGDITGKVNGKAFPQVGPSIVFLDLYNGASKEVRFNKSPSIAIDAPKGELAGIATCAMATLDNRTWKPLTYQVGKISGNAVVFASVAPPKDQTVTFGRDDSYLVVICAPPTAPTASRAP